MTRCARRYDQPAALEPTANAYLIEGAEIPCWPEHVAVIAVPPPEWVDQRLGRPPTRRWPREAP